MFATPSLGINASPAAKASGLSKAGLTTSTAPSTGGPAGSIKFTGSHPVDAYFTSEEFTSVFQDRVYKYDPFHAKDTQVRFNPDGTMESTGKLDKANLANFGKAFNMDSNQIALLQQAQDALPVDPTYYIKGKATVKNNKVDTSEVLDVKVGGVPVPVDVVNSNKGTVSGMFETAIANTPGLDVQSLSNDNGQLHFQGTIPDSAQFAN